MFSISVIEQETNHHSSWGHKVIKLCFVTVTSLSFPIIIFLVIPATMSPTFTLDPASSISSFNISSSRVTTEWTLIFSVENPSKLVPLSTPAYLGSTPLAHAKISPFIQKAASHTNVRANFHSPLPSVSEFSLKILASGLEHGELGADVVLSSGRTLGLGTRWVPAFDASAPCNGVIFAAESDGSSLTLVPGTGYCILGFFSYV